MVWVSFLLLGMNISLRLKKRRDFLSETVVFLSIARLEIEYVSLPVFEILKSVEKSGTCKNLDFISICLNEKEKGEDFFFSWLNAIESSDLPFSKQEKEKLKSLGGLLGTSDTAGQRSILSLFSESFAVYQKKATEAYDKYGKMSVALSGIIGMGVFILML